MSCCMCLCECAYVCYVRDLHTITNAHFKRKEAMNLSGKNSMNIYDSHDSLSLHTQTIRVVLIQMHLLLLST